MAPGTLGGRAGSCPAAEGGVDVLVQSSGDMVPGDGWDVGTGEGEGNPKGQACKGKGDRNQRRRKRWTWSG